MLSLSLILNTWQLSFVYHYLSFLFSLAEGCFILEPQVFVCMLSLMRAFDSHISRHIPDTQISTFTKFNPCRKDVDVLSQPDRSLYYCTEIALNQSKTNKKQWK